VGRKGEVVVLCFNVKGAIAVEYALISALVIVAILIAVVNFSDVLVELWLDTSRKLVDAFIF
jgi:Flp pilus assembly pilin Flp